MERTPFDVLGERLDEAAARQVDVTVGQARVPRHRGRPTALLAALVLTPVVAATAFAAATLLDAGDPVTVRSGEPVEGKGLGTVVPGTAKLVIDDVEDPGGGLPWGLRTFHTSRGFACLQVGRVQDGKLGQLGQDGAFGDDGLFHELRPGIVPDEGQCFPLDGAGKAFLTMHLGDAPASAQTGGCQPYPLVDGKTPRDACERRNLRSLDYGLLGPEATGITALLDGKAGDLDTIGDEGAYLVVGRAQPYDRPTAAERKLNPGAIEGPPDAYLPALTPTSSVITEVRYTGGERCIVKATNLFTRLRSRGGCPDPPGFTLIPQPSAKDTRATVRATARGRRFMRVRFRAPIAIGDRLSGYSIMVYPPRAATRCGAQPGVPRPKREQYGCSGATGDTTDGNLRKGQLVVKDVTMSVRRPGRYRIAVHYRTQSPHPGPRGNLRSPGTLVGETSTLVE